MKSNNKEFSSIVILTEPKNTENDYNYINSTKSKNHLHINSNNNNNRLSVSDSKKLKSKSLSSSPNALNELRSSINKKEKAPNKINKDTPQSLSSKSLFTNNNNNTTNDSYNIKNKSVNIFKENFKSFKKHINNNNAIVNNKPQKNQKAQKIRKDNNGIIITKGSKNHHILFKEDFFLVDVIDVESYKDYNLLEEYYEDEEENLDSSASDY